MAIVTKIDKSSTSEERILAFLEKCKDPNTSLHIGQKVIPGMYYTKLAESHLCKPASLLEVSFTNQAFYPLNLWLNLTRKEDALEFMFHDKEEKELCRGRFSYGTYNEDNNEKFNLLYLIAGKLQRSDQGRELIGEDNFPFYLSQTLEFNGIPFQNPLLKIGVPERIGYSKRDYEIRTDYVNSNGNIFAEGTARIKIVPKKIFDRRKKC